MRRYGLANSYESLKELTRGARIDRAILHQFIDDLALPETERTRLKSLTPETYIGLAPVLAREI
jgi:adenylosuccinate lyase